MIHHFRRYRNITLKILLALAAFYFVFRQVDVPVVVSHVKTMPVLSLILGFAILVLSQVVSGYRMRYYYEKAGQGMSQLFGIALYFVGMLYNTVLPGGVGGDGYKVYLMGKLANFSYLHSFRLMVSNRASGLYILLLYSALLASFSTKLYDRIPHMYSLLAMCVVITTLAYFISIKLLLKETPRVALGALPYSALVQLACLGTAYALFSGMEGFAGHEMDYLMLFMVSSVVSVIPISIGGAGLREVTFLYGATYLGMGAELGVAFSIIFFAINMLCSLCGLFFMGKLERLWRKGGAQDLPQ